MGKLEDALRRAEGRLDEQDYAMLKALADSYAYLSELVGDKTTTIARLRKLLFGAKTEKTAVVIGGSQAADRSSLGEDASPPSPAPSTLSSAAEASPEDDAQNHSAASAPADGHGRNGADAYTGAEKIEVPHESLQSGDPCPKCEAGTLYDTRRPGVLVRLVGQAPVGAKVYYLEKLRCNLCSAIFTAAAPLGIGMAKYDSTVGSMIAVLKYGSGVPFHRAEKLQASLGIPLPASTQWDIVRAQAEHVEPIFEELVEQAAQGDVLYNDDTTVKILALMGNRGQQAASAEAAAENSADLPTKCAA
ncbi:MAG: transposase, partial [Phycisphaerales bacterium]